MSLQSREDIIRELMRQYYGGDPNAQFGPGDGGGAPGGAPAGTSAGGGMTFGGFDTSLTGDAYTGGYGNLGGGPYSGVNSPSDLGAPNTGFAPGAPGTTGAPTGSGFTGTSAPGGSVPGGGAPVGSGTSAPGGSVPGGGAPIGSNQSMEDILNDIDARGGLVGGVQAMTGNPNASPVNDATVFGDPVGTAATNAAIGLGSTTYGANAPAAPGAINTEALTGAPPVGDMPGNYQGVDFTSPSNYGVVSANNMGDFPGLGFSSPSPSPEGVPGTQGGMLTGSVLSGFENAPSQGFPASGVPGMGMSVNTGSKGDRSDLNLDALPEDIANAYAMVDAPVDSYGFSFDDAPEGDSAPAGGGYSEGGYSEASGGGQGPSGGNTGDSAPGGGGLSDDGNSEASSGGQGPSGGDSAPGGGGPDGDGPGGGGPSGGDATGDSEGAGEGDGGGGDDDDDDDE